MNWMRLRCNFSRSFPFFLTLTVCLLFLTRLIPVLQSFWTFGKIYSVCMYTLFVPFLFDALVSLAFFLLPSFGVPTLFFCAIFIHLLVYLTWLGLASLGQVCSLYRSLIWLCILYLYKGISCLIWNEADTCV